MPASASPCPAATRRSACAKRPRRRRSSAARSGSSRRRSTPAAAARAAASSWRARKPKCATLAGQILGMQLVTHQTGPQGQKVRRLLIEEGADIKKEYYVAVLDRSRHAEGGADGIERRRHGHREGRPRHAGEDHPRLHRSDRRPDRRRRRDELAAGIGIPKEAEAQAVDVFKKLYACYMETDASLAEINPLILDGGKNGGPMRSGARRQVQLRLERDLPPPRDRRLCATSTRRTRPRSRRASSTSPTSSSTATSAASSTAPAWRWRRWTRSSCSAASPRTSSTSAAAPRPRR